MGELSGGRDPHRLMVWVLWTLGTTAVLTLLRTAAFHWKEAETDDLWRRQTRTYMDKQMSLDYVDEDSQRVYDMYSQIQQDARLSGAGWHDLHFAGGKDRHGTVSDPGRRGALLGAVHRRRCRMGGWPFWGTRCFWRRSGP